MESWVSGLGDVLAYWKMTADVRRWIGAVVLELSALSVEIGDDVTDKG